MLLPCVLKRAIDFPARWQSRSVRSIQSDTNHFKFRMLVLHRSSHIPMAHRLHHGREVSGVVQHSRAVIVPAAIQNQIFGKSGLRTRQPGAHAEQLPEVVGSESGRGATGQRGGATTEEETTEGGGQMAAGRNADRPATTLSPLGRKGD